MPTTSETTVSTRQRVGLISDASPDAELTLGRPADLPPVSMLWDRVVALALGVGGGPADERAQLHGGISLAALSELPSRPGQQKVDKLTSCARGGPSVASASNRRPTRPADQRSELARHIQTLKAQCQDAVAAREESEGQLRAVRERVAVAEAAAEQYKLGQARAQEDVERFTAQVGRLESDLNLAQEKRVEDLELKQEEMARLQVQIRSTKAEATEMVNAMKQNLALVEQQRDSEAVRASEALAAKNALLADIEKLNDLEQEAHEARVKEMERKQTEVSALQQELLAVRAEKELKLRDLSKALATAEYNRSTEARRVLEVSDEARGLLVELEALKSSEKLREKTNGDALRERNVEISRLRAELENVRVNTDRDLAETRRALALVEMQRSTEARRVLEVFQETKVLKEQLESVRCREEEAAEARSLEMEEKVVEIMELKGQLAAATSSLTKVRMAADGASYREKALQDALEAAVEREEELQRAIDLAKNREGIANDTIEAQKAREAEASLAATAAQETLTELRKTNEKLEIDAKQARSDAQTLISAVEARELALRDELQRSDARLSELSEKIAKTNADYDSALADAKDARMNEARASKTAEAAAATVGELYRTMAALEDKLRAAEEESKKTRDDVEARERGLLSDIDASNTREAELHAQLELSKAQEISLREDLEIAIAKVEAARVAEEMAQRAMSSVSDKENALELREKLVEANMEAVKSEEEKANRLADNAKARYQALKESEKGLEERLQVVIERETAVERALDVARSNEEKAIESKIRLQAASDEVRAKETVAENAIANAKVIEDNAREAIKVAQAKEEEALRAVAAANATNVELQSKISGLDTELKGAVDALNRATADAKDQEEQAQQLLSAANSYRDEAIEMAADLSTSNEELRTLADSLRRDAAEALEQANVSAAEAANERARLREALDTARAKEDDAVRAATIANEMADDLTRQLADALELANVAATKAQDEKNLFRKEVDTARAKEDHAVQEAAAANELNAELRVSVDRLERELAAAVEDANVAAAKAQDEKNLLREEVDTARANEGHAVQEAAAANELNAKLHVSVDRLEKELAAALEDAKVAATKAQDEKNFLREEVDTAQANEDHAVQEVAAANELNTKLHVSVDRLEKELAAALEDANVAATKAQNEKNLLREEVDTARAKEDHAVRDAAAANELNAELRVSVNRLEKELAAALADANVTAAKAQDEKNLLRKEVDTARAKEDRAVREAATANELNAKLHVSVDRLEKELAAALEGAKVAATKAQDEKNLLREEVNTARAKEEHAVREAAAANELNAESRVSVDRLEKELAAALEDATVAIREAKIQEEAKCEELYLAQSRAEVAEKIAASAEATLVEFRSKIERLSSELADTAQDLEAARAAGEALARNVDLAESVASRLREELDIKDGEVNEAIESAMEAKDEAFRVREASSARIRALEVRLVEAENSANSGADRAAQAETRSKEIESELVALRTEAKQAAERAKLADADAAREAERAQELETFLKKSQEELAESRQHSDIVGESVMTLENKLEAVVVLSKKQLAAVEIEHSRLKDELAAEKAKSVNLEVLAALRLEASKLQEQCAALEAEKDEYAAKASAASEEQVAASTALWEQKEAAAKAAEVAALALDEAAVLREKLTGLTQEAREKDEQLDSLRGEISALSTRMRRMDVISLPPGAHDLLIGAEDDEDAAKLNVLRADSARRSRQGVVLPSGVQEALADEAQIDESASTVAHE